MIAEMSKPTPKPANISPKTKAREDSSKKLVKEEGATLNRGMQDPPLVESQFIRFTDSPYQLYQPFPLLAISLRRLISCVLVLRTAYRFRPSWA